MTTDDYLNTDETLERRDLLYGHLVREPSPVYGHQAVVTRLSVLLVDAVRHGPGGIVCVAPLDVPTSSPEQSETSCASQCGPLGGSWLVSVCVAS